MIQFGTHPLSLPFFINKTAVFQCLVVSIVSTNNDSVDISTKPKVNKARTERLRFRGTLSVRTVVVRYDPA